MNLVPRILLSALVLLLLSVGSCSAWIYDAGRVGNGPTLKNGTSTVWAAEPFVLDSDAYVTQLGMGLSRAIGPADAGFDVYLSGSLAGLPDAAFAHWTIKPSGPIMVYCYTDIISKPIYLIGGQMYYLTVAPNSDDFMGGVSYANSPGRYYGLGTGDYGQTWRKLDMPLGLRIDGYFVPEPASLTALLVGVLSLTLSHRKRPA